MKVFQFVCQYTENEEYIERNYYVVAESAKQATLDLRTVCDKAISHFSEIANVKCDLIQVGTFNNVTLVEKLKVDSTNVPQTERTLRPMMSRRSTYLEILPESGMDSIIDDDTIIVSTYTPDCTVIRLK
jgi:hypothetical protein